MAERRGRRATADEQRATNDEAGSDNAADLRRGRDLALAQARATAEVLRVISNSPDNLDASLQAVADAAARLCHADVARVMLRDGDSLIYGPSARLIQLDEPRRPGSRVPMAGSHAPGTHAVLSSRTVHAPDVIAYQKADGATDEEIEQAGPYPLTVVLAVPTLRGSEATGEILFVRGREAGPFSDGEIALAETFAAQAAIAVENARLFDELQERNREQAEALEREQATAEVLRVISRSPENLDTSLQTVAEAAARLCRADLARVWLRQGDDLIAGPIGPPGLPDYWSPGDRIGPITGGPGELERAVSTGKIVHVEDVLRQLEEKEASGQAVALAAERARRVGTRTRLLAPLLRGPGTVGVLELVRRHEVRPFASREIAFAETFADQAAIAVENARLFQGIQDRNRELTDALEQQTATADVLRIISRSPVELESILGALAGSAARLCESGATFGTIEDGRLRLAAFDHSAPTELPDRPLSRDYVGERAALEGRTLHVVGTLADLEGEYPGSAAVMRSEGLTSAAYLGVPLLRTGQATGVFALRRPVSRPFTDQQIALAETFADQAVIAMENARLFDELQERNREQAEALEQQTATAKVLRIISSAPTDLQPVLDTVLDSACQLCGATNGLLVRYDGRRRQNAAGFGFEQWGAQLEGWRGQQWFDPQGGIVDRAIQERRVVRFVGNAAQTRAEFPQSQWPRDYDGEVARLGVPLLREGEPIGGLALRRFSAEPFSDDEVALVQTFADQAVIAMENARLFDELQERNREQAEALEREQATAEVLRVISRAPESLEESLQAVADTARRLCQADLTRVFLRDGEYLVAGPGSVPDGAQDPLPAGHRQGPITDAPLPAYEAVRDARTVYREDLPAYAKEHEIPPTSDGFAHGNELRIGGESLPVRTVLNVPLLRGTEVVGLLALRRYGEVRPFSRREIALAETFADQAAIAVENARLFQGIQDRNRELIEALEQQTATADVLRIISETPTDLERVLDTLVTNATRLSDGYIGTLYTEQRGSLVLQASCNSDDSGRRPGGVLLPLTRDSMTGTAYLDGRVVTFHGTDEERLRLFPGTVAPGYAGVLALIAVPLVREGSPIGAFFIRRRTDRPFSDREIALVKTFADQAVIAMENARLFEEIREKSRELEARNREQAEALEREQATAEVLRVISRSPENLDASLQAVADTAARLCRADFSRLFLLEDDFLIAGPVASPGGITRRIQSGDRIGPISETAGLLCRTAVEGRIFHEADYPRFFKEHWPAATDADQHAVGLRTELWVPLQRGSAVAGVIVFGRAGEPRPFNDREIALAQTFADQAAIAVENARLFQGLQDRNRELTEALEQQTATADVLRIISEAPADLRRVLDALVSNAVRLCDGDLGRIVQRNGDVLDSAAFFSIDPLRQDGNLRFGGSIRLTRGSPSGRAILDRSTVTSYGTEEQRGREFPDMSPGAENLVLAQVAVPLIREGSAIGSLFVRRREERPFTEREVTLLQTFADQAVIAMENARLFDELQQRNREQAEALEREQATAELLRVISRSPEDLDASLQAVADTAARLCRTQSAQVWLRDGEELVAGPAATIMVDPPFPPGTRMGPISHVGLPTAEATNTGKTVHAHDLRRYIEERGARDPIQERVGNRASGPVSVLSVPLVRGEFVVGAMTLIRSSRFDPREIALAETFADQAAIAVENARLFQDIQDRNHELTEALEQQTATADVLRIISEAPADLQRVLDALASNAIRLCSADRGRLYRREGNVLRSVATSLGEAIPHSLPLSRGSLVGRAVLEGRMIVNFGSMADYPDVADHTPGARIAIPLLLEGESVGVFFVMRTEPPFSEKETALLKTFADQAVIAMENARLFDELQARTQQLAAADRAKSEFLSRMSHELRTPLNAIIGFTEIMELEPDTPVAQREWIQHVLKAGRHLLGLINEVLDIARIETGRLSLSLEPVRLDQLVHETLDLVRPLAARSEIRLEVARSEAWDDGWVRADRQRLQQVLLNLATNAVKYNRANGSVAIQLEQRDSEQLRLIVSDSGSGIPAEKLGRLFTPFDRLGAEQSSIEGNGLGLAISKRLVEAMDGRIGVESSEGKGSAFWFELPSALAPSDAQEGQADGLELPNGPDATHSVATILYIEDNLSNLELMKAILARRPQITLISAMQGTLGLTLAREHHPDLILLDLNLPDMHGDDVLIRLQQDDESRTIPVAVISADATATQRQRTLALGARTYLTKPLDVKQLLGLLDEVLAARR